MFQIIPAIDIIDGKCVRLTQGDFSQKTEYNADPLLVAQSFENAGLKRLHLVDLDGAKQKKIVNISVLENIAKNTNLHIDFGGGVQSDEDIAKAFDYGAAQVTGGSIAIKNAPLFEKWISLYGTEKLILGADAKDEKIAVSGWEENTDISIFDFVGQWAAKGIRYVISTDVARDGLLQGAAVELYRKMHLQFPDLQIIASGGVSSIADLQELADLGIYGVITGKALYEKRFTLEELKRFL